MERIKEKLLTNNPKFLGFKRKNLEIDYRETDYLTILKVARDYIHKNFEILTHPMYGSIKPNETLYRSIVLKEEKDLSVNSVALISEAIEVFLKFNKNKDTPEWTESVKEDFRVIDYDLIVNAVERISK